MSVGVTVELVYLTISSKYIVEHLRPIEEVYLLLIFSKFSVVISNETVADVHNEVEERHTTGELALCVAELQVSMLKVIDSEALDSFLQFLIRHLILSRAYPFIVNVIHCPKRVLPTGEVLIEIF